MKIDLNNEQELRATLRELESNAEVIKLALRKFDAVAPKKTPPPPPRANGNGNGTHQMRIPAVAGTPTLLPEKTLTIAQQIREAIIRAPDKFTSTDIYRQFDEKARTGIKDEFRRQKEDGTLRVVETGVGRMPTVYEKTVLNV